MKDKLLRYFLKDERLNAHDESQIGMEVSHDKRWQQIESRNRTDFSENPIEWNTEHELHRLQNRLGHVSGAVPGLRALKSRGFAHGDRDATARRRARQRVAHVGMTLALMLIVVSGVWMWNASSTDDSDRQFVAEKGKRVHLTLDDGTHVVLNADSRLVVKTGFGTSSRNVRLAGEAYFDVRPSDDMPFVIEVDGAVVRVLGTAFGVRAYASDEVVRVVVREGVVSLRDSRVGEDDAVRLGAAEVGYFAGDGAILVDRGVPVDQVLGWLDGHLSFVDRPFGEVARDLERWYDVDIRVLDEGILSLPLTATFDGQPLNHIMNVISRTLDVDVRIENRTIILASRTS